MDTINILDKLETNNMIHILLFDYFSGNPSLEDMKNVCTKIASNDNLSNKIKQASSEINKTYHTMMLFMSILREYQNTRKY